MNIKSRKSIRLIGYDYTQAGAYFVTICTDKRRHMFGDIVQGKMELNKYGEIVREEWLKTEKIRPNVSLDQYVIMPNHFHGIIMIDDCVGARRAVPLHERFGKPIPGGVPTIVGSFKSAVTKRIREISQMPSRPVWQKNYYEYIIRWDKLDETRKYIVNNPGQWDHHIENPVAQTGAAFRGLSLLATVHGHGAPCPYKNLLDQES